VFLDFGFSDERAMSNPHLQWAGVFHAFSIDQCLNAFLKDDFCLWGTPGTNEVLGNEEAELVAYCTKQDHGARLIPPGTITGMQVSNRRFFRL
jgi:hypothetical protein